MIVSPFPTAPPVTRARTPRARSMHREAPDIDRRIEAACIQACGAVAPAWPLDRAIAVNPHWERIGMPLRRVAARMATLGGISVFPPRALLQEAWNSGRISADDLSQALSLMPDAGTAALDVATAIKALEQPSLPARLPLLIDLLDDDPDAHSRLPWRSAITHQVSQVCAAYFDRMQADWKPLPYESLYEFWRETLVHDHGIGPLMGLPTIAQGLGALPSTRQDAERWALRRLGLPEAVWADYLEAVLLTVNGWASWCAYLGWQARLQGHQDPHLRELLAIRLAWGAVLLECRTDDTTQRAFATLRQTWSAAPAILQRAEDTLLVDEAWQLAFELGYQRDLARRLRAIGPRPVAGPRQVADVQAVFCIDVRSERLRRAIESVRPSIQTAGFAGFFGLPLAYTPLATEATRPQLPGLLAPSLQAGERVARTEADFAGPGDALQTLVCRLRRERFARADRWEAASRWPGAAFASVEAVGAGCLGALARWVRPSLARRRSLDDAGLPVRYRPVCRPLLTSDDLRQKIDLAARTLRSMGLDRHPGRLVLLVGHGSQSANNAQAAALDCGACGGQTGEVNARVLARLLNEVPVQAGLRARGVALPDDVAFVAALHNTTTDEIEGFDLDLLSPAARARWDDLQEVFEQAGDQVRRERAGALGLDPRLPFPALLARCRRRANDGAQTRPEWGLAGNAAFLIAPRHRTLGAVLDGRTFLHDYDASADPDGSALELLMTAPMLVTHWINWQYHASSCDPVHLGSGNKLLHNVVGGHIGVFEGNGGDLRIGLARQSLNDGDRWHHEPLRLTVVIDAPAASIERVIAKHSIVRHLVENGWLHLWRLGDDGDVSAYRRGNWETPRLTAYDHARWAATYNPARANRPEQDLP